MSCGALSAHRAVAEIRVDHMMHASPGDMALYALTHALARLLDRSTHFTLHWTNIATWALTPGHCTMPAALMQTSYQVLAAPESNPIPTASCHVAHSTQSTTLCPRRAALHCPSRHSPTQGPASCTFQCMTNSARRAGLQVFMAESRGTDPSMPPQCVLKVVNLGPQCKIREDYKPILRAEGHFLEHFDQPGFVRCYETWGGALKHECALSP